MLTTEPSGSKMPFTPWTYYTYLEGLSALDMDFEGLYDNDLEGLSALDVDLEYDP